VRSTREARASRTMGGACKRRHLHPWPILRDARLRFATAGSSEAVNLSISAIFDMSQIKDLAPPEFAKIEKIRSLSA
jgi:hypothetical protein